MQVLRVGPFCANAPFQSQLRNLYNNLCLYTLTEYNYRQSAALVITVSDRNMDTISALVIIVIVSDKVMIYNQAYIQH